MNTLTRVKPRVGISSCLLGEKVRYDGDHKLHPVIVEFFGPQVEWVPLCPEVEVGMGIPREPVNLVGLPESPALLSVVSGKNWSGEMKSFSINILQTWQDCRLSGYIFKTSSPSCGLRKVKVYKDSSLDQSVPLGIGAFAKEFLHKFPDLPVADEEELSTIQEAVAFLEKIKRHYRLLQS